MAQIVPPNLKQAIEALGNAFDDAHWKFGEVTRLLCYAQLHDADIKEVKEYLTPFAQTKALLGPFVTGRFIEMQKEGTPSAIFKSFFNLYQDGLKLAILSAFNDLSEMGRANESRLKVPYLDWAFDQASRMVEDNSYRIERWIRAVCDVQPAQDDEDWQEQVFWRRWEAPQFLTMKPSMHYPYDATRLWDRRVAESSAGLLKHFSQGHVIQLQEVLRKATGNAAILLAKDPSYEAPLKPLHLLVRLLHPHRSRFVEKVGSWIPRTSIELGIRNTRRN